MAPGCVSLPKPTLATGRLSRLQCLWQSCRSVHPSKMLNQISTCFNHEVCFRKRQIGSRIPGCRSVEMIEGQSGLAWTSVSARMLALY